MKSIQSIILGFLAFVTITSAISNFSHDRRITELENQILLIVENQQLISSSLSSISLINASLVEHTKLMEASPRQRVRVTPVGAGQDSLMNSEFYKGIPKPVPVPSNTK